MGALKKGHLAAGNDSAEGSLGEFLSFVTFLMIYILGRLVHFAAPMFVGIEIKLI
jgi:hypothetical protein